MKACSFCFTLIYNQERVNAALSFTFATRKLILTAIKSDASLLKGSTLEAQIAVFGKGGYLPPGHHLTPHTLLYWGGLMAQLGQS